MRFSPQTPDPAETKKRNALAAVDLETVWEALRQREPVALTQRQVVALAGELYRAWAEGEQRGESVNQHHELTPSRVDHFNCF